MAIEGSLKCIKFLMCIFNILFLLLGIALVITGIVVTTQFSDYIEVLGSGYNVTPILIILLGVIIAVISFFGCYGAMRENKCMINFFAICVIVIFLVQAVCVILAFVKKGEVEKHVESVLRDVVRGYEESKAYHDFMDIVQRSLQCCGASNYTDYHHFNVYNETRVPLSCCLNGNICDPIYGPLHPANQFYETGCRAGLINYLQTRIGVVAGIAAAICFIQLLAIIFACCMVKNIDQYEMV